MPKNWVFKKEDFSNIKDINEKFGTRKIETYPHLTFYERLFYKFVLQIESIKVLDYIEYNKVEAKKIIAKELDWIDYGGKHYESVFTRFYQGYIYLKKLKLIKGNFSTLV